MSAKPIMQPGPDHPIEIEPTTARVRVLVGGRVIADTQDALTLREANYPPVQYIPLADVDTSLLEPSDATSYCPYKGEASYYSVPVGGERAVNAVWEYRSPYAPVAEIKDRVAFYPDRVEQIEELSGVS